MLIDEIYEALHKKYLNITYDQIIAKGKDLNKALEEMKGLAKKTNTWNLFARWYYNQKIQELHLRMLEETISQTYYFQEYIIYLLIKDVIATNSTVNLPDAYMKYLIARLKAEKHMMEDSSVE